MSFFVYVIFFFLFRITWFFCNVLFFNIRNTDMFYTLLINTLFLLASLLVCLLSLRLSINVKYLCLFFHSLLILTDILKFWPPTPPHRPPRFILTPPVYEPPESTFNLRLLYELKHKNCLFKVVRGIFSFVFIKVYILVQQNAWTLDFKKT